MKARTQEEREQRPAEGKRGWRELPLGGVVPQAGSAETYDTGEWRSGKKPVLDTMRCSSCMLCWVYCPDSAIKVENGKVVGIDYDHCKGCGICAAECPVRPEAAMQMVDESEGIGMTISLGNDKGKRIAISGNGAVAQAMRQINPHVVAAYPITPQTDIVEDFAQFVADGLVSTEFVLVESEHSAMSTCVGAAAAGVRVMTATSSQGLALMHEVLYIAAGMRLPIVMPVVNRALSAPVNIHGDHSDSMGSRDAGWLQFYCKNAQEAYDTALMAVRIAEHADVRLPVMVCYDGFITSHALTSIELLPDERAREFVGKPRITYPLLDTEHPVTYGPLALYDYYFELKRQQAEGMFQAPAVIERIGAEFERLFGRSWGLVEEYKLDGAELVVVVLSSAASTMEVVVDEMRAEGVPVGLLRLRSYRPFPRAQITRALRGARAVAVLDRADAPGAGNGPVGGDVRSALYEAEQRPLLMNGIYGLGGRDTGPLLLRSVVERLQQASATGRVDEPLFYLGVRGD